MFARVITVVILALGAILAPANAQHPAKIPRVGFLAPQGRSLPLFDAFRQGLADLGYIDGQNGIKCRMGTLISYGPRILCQQFLVWISFPSLSHEKKSAYAPLCPGLGVLFQCIVELRPSVAT